MKFPCIVQQKLDGVPARIRNIGGHIFAYSRQNEVVKSIPHILQYAPHLIDVGGSFVGEMYIEGMAFQDISGLARKQSATGETMQLVLHVFDADIHNTPERRYVDRLEAFRQRLNHLATALGKAPDDLPIRVCKGAIAHTADEVERIFDLVMEHKPDAEGCVAHSIHKPFQPGTRRWDTMKLKPEPTIDLKIVGFEEAVNKFKQPMDMVGGLKAEFTRSVNGQPVTEIIGIGPGALTAIQRKKLWVQYKTGKYLPTIAEIKYMKDDNYAALRQPTFVRWRDDKSEADRV